MEIVADSPTSEQITTYVGGTKWIYLPTFKTPKNFFFPSTDFRLEQLMSDQNIVQSLDKFDQYGFSSILVCQYFHIKL